MASPPASPPALPPAVRGLGWTSFLTDLSSEAIYPLLPAFIRSLGGTSVEIGLGDGLANAVAAVARLPAGVASDRIGRRPLVLLGYGLSALVRPVMGLVWAPAGVILVRAADRLGKGIRSAPRDALVADLTAPEIRGRAFGHIRALDHAGAALGPLAASLFLFAFPDRLRTLFLLTLLPGLATLAVIWRCVHDVPGRAAGAHARPPAARLTRRQGILLVAVGLWALGASSEQFLLLRAGELGVPAALVPLVWLGVSIAKSAAAVVAGRFTDRRHPAAVLAAGWLLFAAAYAGLATSGQLATTLPLLAAVGVAYGLAEPAERALVAALAPAGGAGGAFGWYAFAQGVMALPAGLLAGWLWARGPHGAGLAFAATAALALAACGLLAGVGRLTDSRTAG
jgi:MFS family permease